MDAFVRSGMQHAKLDHLQLIELNSVRPLLPSTLDAIHKLQDAKARAEKAAHSTADGSSFFTNSQL